jgi:O-antigen/teichoic acid export membrane protein
LSYKKKAANAFLLLLLRRGWTIIINFGVTAYLARTLEKSDFGIVAISSILISFSTALGTGGLGEFIIFKKGEGLRKYYESVFWLNFALALIITIGLMLGSNLWASFYGDPKIKWIVIILSVNTFLSMLKLVPNTILRKEVDFKSIVFITTVSHVVVSILKMVLAYSGCGVYSLIVPEVLMSPFVLIYMWRKSGLEISFRFYTEYWKEIVAYSRGLIGSRILNRFTNDGDTLIIGKILGMTSVGTYNLAFNVSNVVMSQVLPIINDVSYPFLMKINDNIDRLKAAYFKIIVGIAFIAFPILIWLILSSKNVVLIWYGQNWTDVIVLLQILLVFAISRSVSSPTSALFQIAGRNDLAFRNGLFNTVVVLLFVFVGCYINGLIGVCVGVTTARVLTGQYQIYKALKLFDINYIDFLKQIFTPLFISIISGFVTLFISNIISFDSLVLDLVLKSILFISIFIFILRVFFVNELYRVLDFLKVVSPKLYNLIIKILGLTKR